MPFADLLLLVSMSNETNPSESLFRITSRQRSDRLLLIACCAGMIISVAIRCVAGSSESQTGIKSPGADSSHNLPAENLAPSATASKASSIDSKPATADWQSLAGRGAEEVEGALGKPAGKLQTAKGDLWLYADWRVQFDKKGEVLKVEKDRPVRLAKLDPQFVADAEAIEKAAVQRAAADDAARAKAAAPQVEKIRIISNGGQQVDLPSLLVEGKVTIVDFFAEWCGPCRRLGPRLEQLAKDNADIVLLKIDIVNWGTPIVQQFGIQSVPNVRVYRGSKEQIGDAESDFNRVLEHVTAAQVPTMIPLPEVLNQQPRFPARVSYSK